MVFSYVVKGIKIKITAKFRTLRRLRFEDTKRIMSPEMVPKIQETFEKRVPGHLLNLVNFLGASSSGAIAPYFPSSGVQPTASVYQTFLSLKLSFHQKGCHKVCNKTIDLLADEG